MNLTKGLIIRKLNKLDKQIIQAYDKGKFDHAQRLEEQQWKLSDKLDNLVYKEHRRKW